jgi:hypothetical protein
VTKPVKVGAGIGVAGAVSAILAALTGGFARILWAWTAVSCAVACAAYLLNRPAWLGKRDGRLSPRALALWPYVIAFRIACAVMRAWRGADAPTRVAPGLWVGGRIDGATLPPAVTTVVDLVAEYSAPRAIRDLPGYRSLPVLDGGYPPDTAVFLDLVRELIACDGDVLVHCDSGRGRAPTMAAALLVARGQAGDVDGAVAMIRARRPVAAPTRSDLVFLDSVSAALRAIAGGEGAQLRRHDAMS